MTLFFRIHAVVLFLMPVGTVGGRTVDVSDEHPTRLRARIEGVGQSQHVGAGFLREPGFGLQPKRGKSYPALSPPESILSGGQLIEQLLGED